MTLIFLNRFFHPDHSATSQMLTDLACALAAGGHDVRVITSRQRYDAPDEVLPTHESVTGVDVTRVWTSRFGRANLAGRAVDYLSFYLTAAWALWRLARAGDVVIAKTDPPALSIVVAPVAWLRGARLVNWLQDIFPEVAEALGMGRGRLARPALGVLRWLRNRSLRSARMNVVLGDGMAWQLKRLGVPSERIHIIPNWADGRLIRPVPPHENALRRAWVQPGDFVVAYSGNLGRAHETATMLEAIRLIEASAGKESTQTVTSLPDGSEPLLAPRIVWLFVGGGAQMQALRQDVAAAGLTSVIFKPYQQQEALAESLSVADVHLISLRPAMEGLIVPSKIYGIQAAGRPALFIGDKDGEIARLLARTQAGLTVAEGDGAALASVVQALAADRAKCTRLGQNARRAFEREFDKPLALARWEKLLAVVAAPGRP